MNEFIAMGWKDCLTSRYESKRLDDAQVDLCNTNPFSIQAKAWERAPAYHKILSEMPETDNINMIFHKKNHKGEVVVMFKDDFYKLINRIPKIHEIKFTK